ncbi:hypothetical protein [Streptococcus dentiloxodontae]
MSNWLFAVLTAKEIRFKKQKKAGVLMAIKDKVVIITGASLGAF